MTRDSGSKKHAVGRKNPVRATRVFFRLFRRFIRQIDTGIIISVVMLIFSVASTIFSYRQADYQNELVREQTVVNARHELRDIVRRLLSEIPEIERKIDADHIGNREKSRQKEVFALERDLLSEQAYGLFRDNPDVFSASEYDQVGLGFRDAVRYEKAIQLFHTAIDKAGPRDDQLFFRIHLAGTLFRNNEFDEGVKYFNEALSIAASKWQDKRDIAFYSVFVLHQWLVERKTCDGMVDLSHRFSTFYEQLTSDQKEILANEYQITEVEVQRVAAQCSSS